MSKINVNSFDAVVNNLTIAATAGVKCVLQPLGDYKKPETGSQYLWSAQENPTRKNIGYLNMDNLHKIIQRFLVEKGMSKAELARVLKITVKNLDHLFSDEIPAGLLSKVNLPLVSLYCSTRWE